MAAASARESFPTAVDTFSPAGEPGAFSLLPAGTEMGTPAVEPTLDRSEHAGHVAYLGALGESTQQADPVPSTERSNLRGEQPTVLIHALGEVSMGQPGSLDADLQQPLPSPDVKPAGAEPPRATWEILRAQLEEQLAADRALLPQPTPWQSHADNRLGAWREIGQSPLGNILLRWKPEGYATLRMAWDSIRYLTEEYAGHAADVIASPLHRLSEGAKKAADPAISLALYGAVMGTVYTVSFVRSIPYFAEATINGITHLPHYTAEATRAVRQADVSGLVRGARSHTAKLGHDIANSPLGDAAVIGVALIRFLNEAPGFYTGRFVSEHTPAAVKRGFRTMHRRLYALNGLTRRVVPEPEGYAFEQQMITLIEDIKARPDYYRELWAAGKYIPEGPGKLPHRWLDTAQPPSREKWSLNVRATLAELGELTDDPKESEGHADSAAPQGVPVVAEEIFIPMAERLDAGSKDIVLPQPQVPTDCHTLFLAKG